MGGGKVNVQGEQAGGQSASDISSTVHTPCKERRMQYRRTLHVAITKLLLVLGNIADSDKSSRHTHNWVLVAIKS